MQTDFTNEIKASKPIRRGRILSVVLLYAMFASSWILLSDKIVFVFFNDPNLIMLASVIKGWLFVAVTALLLYVLMLHRLEIDPVPESADPTPNRHKVLFGLLVSGIILLTASGIVHTFKSNLNQAETRLQAIADLKSGHISDWIEEHRRDVAYIQTYDGLASNFIDWQTRGNIDAAEKLKQDLEAYSQTHGFYAVTVFGSDQQKLWGNKDSPAVIEPPLRTAAKLAIRENEVVLVDTYADQVQTLPRLDFVIPLANAGISPPTVIFHLVLNQSLFPNIQRWPDSVQSGETVLFRRDGNDVFYLIRKSNDDSALLPKRQPINTPDLITARLLRGDAALGQLIKGKDYRNVPVIAATNRISGTDWILMAKLDKSELYADAINNANWIGFTGLLVLFLSAAGYYLNKQQQKLALVQALQQSQTDRIEALNLLSAIADSSDAAIFAKDLAGRFVFFNQGAAKFVGRKPEEVLGLDEYSIFPAEQAAEQFATESKAIAENRIITEEEVRSTVYGETTFLTSKGPLYDAEGKIIGLFGISRDITQRKQTEETLRRQTEELLSQNIELERFNRAMVGRELDMVKLKQQINELSQQLGLKSPYPLAFMECATQQDESQNN